MELSDLAQRTASIRRLYAEWEKERYGRSWTPEEIALPEKISEREIRQHNHYEKIP